jgi:hypothetical protein|tara:strand:+ start:14416 stop:15498 length:1083 start_codon:yes stop_codon:yes gene_type:complete
MNKNVKLSASRISTAKKCSWLYYCKYILKLPDTSNDGASRGWICHLIFECLGNPRHKKTYNKIIKTSDIFSVSSIERLVRYHARKLNVNDEENIELIKDMTLNGLLYDFFGTDNGVPTKAISEEKFDLKIDEDGKRYNILGFIDKLFLYKKKKQAIIRDFKTSKQVFKGAEITDNMQDLMYCLAVKHLYPEYLKRKSEFLFLKFEVGRDLLGKPTKGIVEMAQLSEEELEGFEFQLTEIQKYLESFGMDEATSNFAGDQGYPSDGTFGGPLVCGKDGFKMSRGSEVLDKDGNPIKAYICAFRKPFDYYVLLNEDGTIAKTCFLEDKDSLKKSDKQTIEKRTYEGCPRWTAKKPLDDEFTL